MRESSTQDRAEWLAGRRKYLGGTDFAKLLGASPWGGPLDVWLDKVEGVHSPGKWIMDLGNFLESAVAQLWCDRRGMSLDKPGPFFHSEHLFIGGNPDFLPIEDRALGLEIKTASSWGLQKAGKWGEDGTGDVPLDYWVQSQIYMGLTGRSRWELMAAFYDVEVAERLWRQREHIAPGVFLASVLDEVRLYRLEFDAEFYAMAVREGVAFWIATIAPWVEHEIKIVPPVEGTLSDVARAWALQRVAAMAPKVWTADEEAEAVLARYRQGQHDEKTGKASKEKAKEELEALMAKHSTQEILGRSLKYKLGKGGESAEEDAEAIIATLADLAHLDPDALQAIRVGHTTRIPKTPSARLTDVGVKKSSKSNNSTDSGASDIHLTSQETAA